MVARSLGRLSSSIQIALAWTARQRDLGLRPNRGRIVKALEGVPLDCPASVERVAIAMLNRPGPVATDCAAAAAWAEALAATPGSGSPAAQPLWEALAAASVDSLRVHRDKVQGWLPWGASGSTESLADVSRLAFAIAVAAPKAGIEVGFFNAAASVAAGFAFGRPWFGVSLSGADSLRSLSRDPTWRRLAGACASAGCPMKEVFGDPDIRADARASGMVWNSLTRLAEDHPISGVRSAASFPIVCWHNWMESWEAKILIDAAEGFWDASPLAVPGAAPLRKSQSAILAPSRLHETSAARDVVSALRNRVAGLFSLPESHVEPPQLVRYGVGDYYAPHVDWGKADDPSIWFAGQRVASALVYLQFSPGTSGGATIFGKANVRLDPVPGTLVAWPNVDVKGEPLQEADHEAEPLAANDEGEVEQPLKVALNIWVRDRPLPRHV